MHAPVRTARAFYGAGIAGLGVQQLISGDYRPVIFPPAPAWMHVTILACITGVALIVAGTLIVLGKKTKTVALFLGTFLLFLFLTAQTVYILFLQPNFAYHLGLWTDPLKELALSGGAFVMAGVAANGPEASNGHYQFSMLTKFIPFARIFFCITMIAFGIDHFFYTDFVAGLVPSWVPDHPFWTYFGGVALIASGVAILLKIRLKAVCLLLSLMLFLWVVLLHIPRAIARPYIADGNEITSVFEALAFSGIALGILCIHKNRNTDIKITFFKPAQQYEKDKQH